MTLGIHARHRFRAGVSWSPISSRRDLGDGQLPFANLRGDARLSVTHQKVERVLVLR